MNMQKARGTAMRRSRRASLAAPKGGLNPGQGQVLIGGRASGFKSITTETDLESI